MASIAYVVARSEPQHVIGFENKLLWKLRTDMNFFKDVTTGHAVIMGRKTYDSIGHPLRNRLNIVLSRHLGNNGQNLRWVSSPEEALFAADIYSILSDKTQILIIGGEKIYDVFSKIVNKVFLTEVYGHFQNGDAFFRTEFDRRKWEILDKRDYTKTDVDEYPFRITVLGRRRKYVRQRDPSEFLKPDLLLDDWLRSQVVSKAEAFERLPEEQYQLPIS